MKMTVSRAGLVAVSSAFLAGTPEIPACGLSWEKPESHFDGVDYEGDVYLVERLGQLDAGRGLVLPIYAAFESAGHRVSPYLGSGWELPLLEAHMIQLDENTFRLNQPNGRFRLFWRDRKIPAVLNGQGGWKAEIKGATITAWADCGSKIVLNNGKITQLQERDRILNYVYSGGKVSEIRENGKTLLKVEVNARTGVVEGLSLEKGARIAWKLGNKPRMQRVQGKNLVAGVDPSLGEVTLPDETIRKFDFAVDRLLQPTVKLDGLREIAWDPGSGKILRDGDWTYQIVPSSDAFTNAAIGRTNAKGQKEFWHYDGARGFEISKKGTGDRITKSWFVSGPLRGQVRKIVAETPGGPKVLRSNSYDEKGRVIRTYEGTVDATSTIAYEGNSMLENTRFSSDSAGQGYRKTIKDDQIVAIDGDLSRLLQISETTKSTHLTNLK